MRPTNLKRTVTGADGSGSATESTSGLQLPGNPPQAAYVSTESTQAGTCPGGGRCNGTGGHAGCSGCPAFNNRISKTQQLQPSTGYATQERQPTPQIAASASTYASQQGPVPVQTAGSVMPACQNCGTTVTPLWRRDDNGHTICNACGELSFAFSFMSYSLLPVPRSHDNASARRHWLSLL